MKTSHLFTQLSKDQFLPTFIDHAAAKFPSRTYISIPADYKDATRGWRDISFSTFAKSVNKAASWLVGVLGPGSKDFDPIHFLLPGDLSNLIFVLASWKAGYKGIFCHPEAPSETHVSINTATGCKILCFSGQLPTKALALCSADPDMRIIASPPLGYWLDGPEIAPPPLPYTSLTPDEVKKSPLAVVHSSGTTGIPKPITLSHGRFMSMVRSLMACDRVDRLNYIAAKESRIAVLVPITIAAGLFHNFGANFIYDYTPVLRRIGEPLTLKTLEAMMLHADIAGAVTTPKVLPGILQDPVLLQRFKDKINCVIYAGAPLAQDIGDVLTQHTKLSSAYGSTETGVYPIYLNEPEDWAYYEFDPVFNNALKPIGELGYHEIVLPRSSNVDGPFQAVFDLYPEIDEWRTKDIFIQHSDPSKKRLWRYVGRAEDLIPDGIQSSTVAKTKQTEIAGNPFLPNEMESAVNSSTQISGAVICENRAGNIAIVIEPSPYNRQEMGASGNGKEAFVDSVWPTIEAANSLCLIPAKIKKELVVVATEPLSRGTKGDPQRPWVQKTYSEAINRAYTSVC